MQERGIDLLKALEVYVCVADTGSMTAAARTLHISQSAVSQYVRQLEKELEQNLLDRSVRPIQVTAAGALLRKQAVKLLVDAGEVRSSVRQAGRTSTTNLRFAVIGSLAGTLVPELVATLTERLSVQRISVRRGLATTHENALARREVDLLITSDPLLDVEGLERYEIYGEPFILVTPVDFDAKSQNLSQFADALPFIRYTARSLTGWAIETHLRRLRLKLPDNIQFDSSEDVVATVAAGRGWAISTPSHVLHGMRTSDSFNLLPLPKPGFRRTINLIARSGELGELPHQVAAVCCEVIAGVFVPKILELAPWLKGQLEIGEVA